MKFLTWLTRSSADPKKTSLAVYGALTLATSYIVSIAPLACKLVDICIDPSVFPPIVDLIEKIVYGAMIVVGSALTLFGMIRKIYLGRWTHPDAV